MGRMVADVRWSVDALTKHEFIDTTKIFVAGYSLGGTVGLYSTALDERIAGLVSICGFTPMRLNTPGKTAEGIYEYSHLHGLLPRLGFFIENEDRIPYDFHEVLAAIAPRPLLIVAPTWDQYAYHPDIQQGIDEVKKVFQLYGKENQVELFSPEDYNRFSDEMQDKVISWMMDQQK
jgi:pimeloyl-ACP methyl ester carboxylesterase